MAITRSKKADQLQQLVEKFRGAEGVAFAKFNRATVGEVQDVRRSLRKKGMSYSVLKKTLIALAAKEAGICEFSSDDLPGAVAVIVSPDDAVAPAQEIKRFKKESFDKEIKASKFDFAGAIFEGQFLDAVAAAQFANTLTRKESLTRIISMLRAGPQKIHGVLHSGFQKLHNILKNAEKFAA